jgi:hypothetical protein
MRVCAVFSDMSMCLPLGSLNLWLPALLIMKVAVIPAGILPITESR